MKLLITDERRGTTSSNSKSDSTSNTMNQPFDVKATVDVKDAKKAAAELMGLVSNMAVQEATEQFHKLSDEITSTRIRLNRDDDHDDNSDHNSARYGNGIDNIRTHRKQETISLKNEHGTTDANVNSTTNTSKVINDGQDHSGQQQSDSAQDANVDLLNTDAILPVSYFNEGNWDYAIEKLIYISTFNVTLLPPNNDEETSTIYKQNIKISLTSSSSIHNGQKTRRHCIQSIVQIVDTHKSSSGEHEMKVLATFKLPFAILSTQEEMHSSLRVESKNVISFRLQYHDAGQAQIDSIIPETTNVLTPVGALNNLQCRSCEQYLLLNPCMVQGFDGRTRNDGIDKDGMGRDVDKSQPISVIRNVFHLPTGHWDEITDYLTCYDGVSEVKVKYCTALCFYCRSLYPLTTPSPHISPTSSLPCALYSNHRLISRP